MYLAKGFTRRANGDKWIYWMLKESEWNKDEKRPVQRYLAYIGPRPELTLAKAKRIAEKLGKSLEELRKVRGLKILDESDDAR